MRGVRIEHVRSFGRLPLSFSFFLFWRAAAQCPVLCMYLTGQALQQVVGAAAMYNHLLVKHGGVGTKPKEDKTSKVAGAGAADKNGNRAVCDCGGGSGSCKV